MFSLSGPPIVRLISDGAGHISGRTRRDRATRPNSARVLPTVDYARALWRYSAAGRADKGRVSLDIFRAQSNDIPASIPS